MRTSIIVLAVAVAFLGVAVIVVLGRSPLVAQASNNVFDVTAVGSDPGSFHFCQETETIPAGTTAIRLWLVDVIGPKVSVQASFGSRVFTEGSHAPGWTGVTVEVPVKRVAQTVTDASICVFVGVNNEVTLRLGEPAVVGRRSVGVMRIEFMRPANQSWWAKATTIVRHMSYGHAWRGTWIVFFLGAAMIAVLGTASLLVLSGSS